MELSGKSNEKSLHLWNTVGLSGCLISHCGSLIDVIQVIWQVWAVRTEWVFFGILAGYMSASHSRL